MNHLILYTKQGCHLCDVMKETVLKVKNDLEFKLELKNIEATKELNLRFKTEIPVLTVNGRIFAKYSLDENKLRKKLNS